MTDVAVVIGNYEGERFLPECLESLESQTRAPVDVVVVDASSRDRSVEVARQLRARTLVVPNRGLGYLYNRGVETVAAPYVLLSNVDVAYERDCIALLAAALDDDRARFAADVTQLDWEANEVVHARTTLGPGAMTREYFPGLHLDDRAHADSVVPTVAANGAAMLVRRDVYLELGGFDETFFLEWEDLDLCWRAWLRGRPSVYVPDARVRHRVGAVTGASDRPRRSASSHHNILRFALKCLPLGALVRVVAGELLRLPRHPRAIGRGLASVSRELPEILRLRRQLAPGPDLPRRMIEDAP